MVVRPRRFTGRLASFAGVGLVNAVVDYAALNALLWVWPTRSAPVIAAYNLVAVALANVSSYICNTRWTFKSGRGARAAQTRLFALQAALNVAVSAVAVLGITAALLHFTRLGPVVTANVAKLAAGAIATLLSFVSLHYFIYPDRHA